MVCGWTGRWYGSSLPPPPGQRAARLQIGDLLLQQLVLEQHLAEPRFEPLALERLAVRGSARQGGFSGSKESITPRRKRRRRDAERARDRLQVLATKQAKHRIPLALPRHPPTAAGRRWARLLRSLRGARPLRRGFPHQSSLAQMPSAYGMSHPTVEQRMLISALGSANPVQVVELCNVDLNLTEFTEIEIGANRSVIASRAC